MTIAAASVDVRTRLRAFYPMLSEQSFEEKIAQAKDPFTFFRSFVPYFYVLLAEEPGLTAEIPDSVRACEGWCVGDPHPENFGSALLANDARVFAVSDVDDGGPGFFYADFLRFLCGARLGKPEVDVSFERVLAAYLFGLQNDLKGYSFPATVTDLLSRSDPKKADDIEDDSFTKPTPLSGERLTAVLQSLTAVVRARLEIERANLTTKIGGGSHGLPRYRAQVTRPGRDMVHLLELKTVITPGIAPLSGHLQPPDTVRISTLQALVLGKERPRWYGVTRNPEGPTGWMICRPRWRGAKNINLSKVTEYSRLLEAEAAVLGNVHRKTAHPTYARAIADTSAGMWASVSTTISQRMANARP